MFWLCVHIVQYIQKDNMLYRAGVVQCASDKMSAVNRMAKNVSSVCMCCWDSAALGTVNTKDLMSLQISISPHPCYLSDIEDLPPAVQEKLFDEVLDRDVQKGTSVFVLKKKNVG